MLKSDVSNNYQNKIDLNLEKNTHKEVLYQSTDSKVATLTMKDPLASSKVKIPPLRG